MQRYLTMRAAFGAGFGAIVLACTMLAATPGRAQEESPITKFLRGALSVSPDANPAPDAHAPEQGAASDPQADAAATDPAPAADASMPDDSAINWSALNSDPPAYDQDAPVKTLRAPAAPGAPPGLDVSRSDKPDGSASMSLKHPLTVPWETKVGADVSLAAPPPTTYQPDRPLPGSVTTDNGAGGAWLSTDAPGVGTIGARVDAAQDKRKLGTTFERSVPLGEALSVTVHGAYAVTDNSGAPRDHRLGAAGGGAGGGGGAIARARQREARQVQHPADRHLARRRRHLDQHGYAHAPQAGRRAGALSARCTSPAR